MPPQVGDDILPRAHLLEQIFRTVNRKRLTLISAPAGSGKTVTAASLGHAYPVFPLAWLALDDAGRPRWTARAFHVLPKYRSVARGQGNADTVLAELIAGALEGERLGAAGQKLGEFPLDADGAGRLGLDEGQRVNYNVVSERGKQAADDLKFA